MDNDRDSGYVEGIQDAINVAGSWLTVARATGNYDQERVALDIIHILERKI